MKLVDNLEDQLIEEKARLMSMLEFISRSDLESDPRPRPRPQLGLVSLDQSSPSSPHDEAEEKLRRPSQTYASLIREVNRPYI